MNQFLFRLVGNQLHGIALQVFQNSFVNFISPKQEFTAFDVTSAIRAEVGKYVEVLHDDVRQWVHEAMKARPDYYPENDPVRSCIIYKRVAIPAKRPAQFIPQFSIATPVKTTAPNPPVSMGTLLENVNLNKSGLCIPRRFVDIALNYGNKKYKVVLDGSQTRFYTSDHHNNVRVDRRLIEKNFGPVKSVYVKTGTDGDIYILPR